MATIFHLDSRRRDTMQYRNPCDYVVNESQISQWSSSLRKTSAIPTGKNEAILSMTFDVNMTHLAIPYPRPAIYSTTYIPVTVIDGDSSITVDSDSPPDGSIVMPNIPGNGMSLNTAYYVVNSTPTSFQISSSSGGSPLLLPPSSPLGLYLYILTPAELEALTAALYITEEPLLYVRFQTKDKNDKRLIQTINSYLQDAQFVMIPDRTQFSSYGEPTWIHLKSAVPSQVYRLTLRHPIIFQILTRADVVLEIYNSGPDNVDRLKQTLSTFIAIPYIKDGKYTNQAEELEVDE